MSERIRDLFVSESTNASLAGELSRLANAAEAIADELKRKREREERENEMDKEVHVVAYNRTTGGTFHNASKVDINHFQALEEIGGTIVSSTVVDSSVYWTIEKRVAKKAKTAEEAE